MAKGDIISRLRLESGEFDSKIKRAGQELLAYAEHCKKMSQSMGYANQDAKDFAKALGSMQTVSQTARGKINELSEAFVNAKVMYKNMTDEEKKGEFGRNLAASLDQLKVRLNDAKKDLADVTKELNGGGGKFGEFGNVLDTLGSKLGVTGNLTEMLTSKTALLTGAVGAGIAVVTKSAEAWASYNAELAKQDQVTQVTTGLKGEDADRMTDKMRALSDTYKVDFREAVNAANTLMTQFGKTGDEATQLIKDGMRGMIQGDGPKLLSMIQQYAPAFRDAGVSASQLVAVIQNSEGGIFTDQNMNAIVMGIKNIRLMTDATSQSLAKMGIDGKKMSEQLNNGTLTVFDALKQVAAQLQTVDSNSKTAGEVMQQVFGRQGVTAGTNLAKAIETLNTDLEQTKVQTGEVGDSLADLQEANEKLNTAIRDCFEYDGWDNMARSIKSNLVTALASVLEKLAGIKRELGDLFGGKTLAGQLGDKFQYSDVKKTQQWINNGKTDDERRQRYDKAIAQLQAKLNKIGQEYSVKNADGSVLYKIDDAATQAKKRAALEKRMSMLYATSYTPEPEKTDPVKPIRPTKTTKTTGSNNTPKELTETQQLQKRITELTKEYQDLSDAEKKATAESLNDIKQRKTAIQGEIKANQQRIDEIKRYADEAQGKISILKPGSIAALNKELQDYQKAQQLATNRKEWDALQLKIDETKGKIALITGELPKGQQATFTVSVDSSNAEELKKTLEEMGDKDIKITTSYDDTELQDMPGDQERTVTFTADDSDVLAKVADIKGITIDPKTLEFRANDAEAMKAVEGMKNVTIDQKTLTVIPQTLEAAKELLKLNTFKLVDKQVAVTVNDEKAMKDLQTVAKVTIPTKEVKVNEVKGETYKAPNPKPIEQKVNQVQGDTVKPVNIPDQNVTVNYKTGSVDLEDIPDEKDVKVNTEFAGDLQDGKDEERTIKFTADDTEVKKTVDDIEKKDIPAKNIRLEVTTDNAEAFKKINDELAAKGLTSQVKLEPKVEPKVDLKGLNEQAINAKIAEIKKNLSGLTIGSKEWIDLKGLEADALAFSNMLQTAIKNGMDVTSLNPEDFWKKIFGGTDIATTELQSMLDQINAYLQEKGLDPIKLNFTTGEIQGKTKEESNKFADEFSKFAGEFVGGLSSVSSGLSKLGVELPEGVGKVLNVLQGVTEVINGVNAIIQSTQVGAIVANTAAVTANTAALGGSTVAGAAGGAAGLAGLAGGLGTAGLVVGGAALLGSIFGLFHNGGIVRAANGYTVPGNYGYDAVPAMLTSGELVLNRAQQGVLADALQSGGGNGNLRLETYVSGRDLRIVLNNESQGRLKGKYVTSNNVR